MAAKVLKNSDAIQAESFRQECALLEQLRHLHVVQFYAHILGEDGTVKYIHDIYADGLFGACCVEA